MAMEMAKKGINEDVEQRKYLPEDVIYEHILPFLPIKPLTQFKTFKIFPHLATGSMEKYVLCVLGGCLAKCTTISQNDLIFETFKSPGRVVSVPFSCHLRVNDDYHMIGFTKTGKGFAVHMKLGRLGILDPSSKKSLAEFRGLLTFIDSYFPSHVSPLPSADLANEPN